MPSVVAALPPSQMVRAPKHPLNSIENISFEFILGSQRYHGRH